MPHYRVFGSARQRTAKWVVRPTISPGGSPSIRLWFAALFLLLIPFNVGRAIAEGDRGTKHDAATESVDGSFSSRYQQIDRAYQTALAEFLKRADRPPNVGLGLKRDRDERLSSLMREIRAVPLDSLSSDDLVTAATAAEALGSVDVCISFAQRCVAEFPRQENAYFPLVRQLLQRGDHEQAERVAVQGRDACGPDSHVGSLRGPLFMDARHRKDYDAAHRHIVAAVKHFTHRSHNHAADAGMVGLFVKRYRDLVAVSGTGESRFEQTLASCSKDVRQRVARLDASPRGMAETGRYLGQYQIACFLAHSRVEIVARQAELIEAAARLSAVADDEEVQELIGSFLTYVGENSMHWRADDTLDRALERAIAVVSDGAFRGSPERSSDQNASNPLAEKNTRQLRRLKKVSESQARLASHFGRPWRLDDVDWHQAPAGSQSRCRIVCFWRTLSYQPTHFFPLVYQLAGDPRVEVRLVANYSGFALSPKSVYPVRRRGITASDELNFLAQALPKPMPANLSVGLIDPDSQLASVAPTQFPTFLLLDEDQRLLHSVWGVGHAQQAFLKSQVRQLLRQGDANRSDSSGTHSQAPRAAGSTPPATATESDPS